MQTNAGQIVLIRCNKIIPSKLKPYSFDENIAQLSESIKKSGILQPLSVRPLNYGLYEVISGNRRLSASKLAGISSVPCVIIDTDEKSAAGMNFVENSFRKKYSAFDEADIIKSLILNYGFTIDEISQLLLCDITEIIDKLRLLHFSREKRIKVENSKLTQNQCKMLIKLENTEFFDEALDTVVDEKFNDFQTEQYINKLLTNLRSTVVFKNISIFTKTVANAVDKMKTAGVDIIFNQTENEEIIRYSIVITKSDNSAIKSQ